MQFIYWLVLTAARYITRYRLSQSVSSPSLKKPEFFRTLSACSCTTGPRSSAPGAPPCPAPGTPRRSRSGSESESGARGAPHARRRYVTFHFGECVRVRGDASRDGTTSKETMVCWFKSDERRETYLSTIKNTYKLRY